MSESMTTAPSHHSRRASPRGFTLVELMIAVAIVGIVSALAVVSYRKYLNSAQAGEAKAMMAGIRTGEEAYRSEQLVYLSVSSSLTDYYPNATPDDTRWNFVRPSDARYTDTSKGWRLLNVVADSPVRFGYSVVAGTGSGLPAPGPGFASPPVWPAVAAGVPWYVMQAQNRRAPSSPVILFIGSSFTDELYWENDDQ